MKNNRSETTMYRRFMHWAEGDDSIHDQELALDPEHIEFSEYIEYLDSHKYIDFEEYRRRRDKKREKRGLEPTVHHSHVIHDVEVDARQRKTKERRFGLKHAAILYWILAVCITLVLMAALMSIAIELPAFGDPEAPTVNEVSDRYLEKGLEETGAVNAVAGMILDYRAFDTFGESTVLFAAAMSVVLLMRGGDEKCGRTARETDRILNRMGYILLPMVMMYGIYVVLNGHLSPGGGFSGGTVLGCGLILSALVVGEERMAQLLPAERITKVTVVCLLAYGLMKGYSFFTGANHVGWEIPKGDPGAIFSAGFILPLNICVGVIVACTMYTFYTLFIEKED